MLKNMFQNMHRFFIGKRRMGIIFLSKIFDKTIPSRIRMDLSLALLGDMPFIHNCIFLDNIPNEFVEDIKNNKNSRTFTVVPFSDNRLRDSVRVSPVFEIDNYVVLDLYKLPASLEYSKFLLKNRQNQ